MMCTARPLCQKSSVPPAACTPPRLWAQGFHPRSPAAISAARCLAGLSRHTQHPDTPSPARRAEKELCWVQKSCIRPHHEAKEVLKVPCPTPAPKSPPALPELRVSGASYGTFTRAKLGGYRARGMLPTEPSSDPRTEGRALPWQHGQRRIPAGAHPWAPQQHQRPPGTAPAGSAAPQASVKKTRTYHKKEKERKQGSPLQPPLEGSLRFRGSPLSTPRTPPRWLCTPVWSPCTPARSPHMPARSPLTPARSPRTLTSGTAARPVALGAFLWPCARPWRAAVSSRRDVTARQPSSPRLP